MLVLVIGDLHIPQRSQGLPDKFKDLLEAGSKKIQHILCTGNLCNKETLDFLRSLVPTDVNVVKGTLDDVKSFPEQKTVTIGSFKIGLFHGHQITPWNDLEALAKVQRSMDVDILITGETHQFSVASKNGILFLNPGSATGAWSGFSSEVTPSLILLDIEGSRIIGYVYTLPDADRSQLNVQKFEFQKDSKS